MGHGRFGRHFVGRHFIVILSIVTTFNYFHMSALHDAARDGDLERVQELVEQGADKEKTGGMHRWTPLYIASRNGHLQVVRYLAEQGVDVE